MAKPNVYRYDLLILLCIVFLMLLILGFQKKSGSAITAKKTESLNYLLSGAFLKGTALGYDEAFADFLWVKAVGYFGSHVKTDQDYTWLMHMLRLTAELDPRYESPYEFAGVILPSELNKVDEGIAFLKEGVRNIPKHNPRYWLQHFYLGVVYMVYKNEPIKAARHFEAASKFPRSPDYLPLLIGRLYASVNKPQMGIEMIQNLLNDSDNELARNEYMRGALEKRMKELMITQDILMLENAISDYSRTYGQRPVQLKDLVDGLILPFIPADPFNGVYYLSMDGSRVYSSVSEGRFQIYKSDEKPSIGTTSR